MATGAAEGEGKGLKAMAAGFAFGGGGGSAGGPRSVHVNLAARSAAKGCGERASTASEKPIAGIRWLHSSIGRASALAAPVRLDRVAGDRP